LGMETKICTKCGNEKPATEENFYKHKNGLHGLASWCKECFQLYRNDHADDRNRKSLGRKLLVLSNYGGSCSVCGITDPAFLTIDHINNDGSDQKFSDPSSRHLYDWLIRNNFPQGFQALCWNHNHLKFFENRRLRNNRSAEKYVRSNDKIKCFVIGHYGVQCVCCGETNINILTIDHINGHGNKHRIQTGCGTGVKFYRWLRDNNFPSEFRVLCCNCNDGRRVNGGVCPHELRRSYGKRLHQVSDLVTSRVPSINSGYPRGYPQANRGEQHKVLEHKQCLQVGHNGQLCCSNQEGSTKCPVQNGRGLNDGPR